MEPLLDTCFQGFNGAVLAYGQTGAGKTHTMGTGAGESSPTMQGILPRAVQQLFERIGGMRDIEGEGAVNVTVRVSYLEIYMEEVTDLLAPSGSGTIQVCVCICVRRYVCEGMGKDSIKCRGSHQR